MLEMDKREMYEESVDTLHAPKKQTGFFAALQKKFSGAGEEAKLHGRHPFLLIALLIASLAWVLSDSTEPETAALVTPPSAQTPEAVRYEETMGMKDAQADAKVADPFCLLHSEEQAALAAIAAVGGGDSAGDDMVAGVTGRKADVGAVSMESTRAHDTRERARETAQDKTAEHAVVPKVRGTVASGGGTVVLLSIGEREFFLSEGEEKNGVWLQSLSEKNAVVVVDGKSYTLSLPT